MAGEAALEELTRAASFLLLAGALLPAASATPFLVIEVYGGGVYGYSFPLGAGVYLVAVASTAIGLLLYAYAVRVLKGALCSSRCPEFTAAAVAMALLVLPQLFLQVAPPALTSLLIIVMQLALLVYIVSAASIAYRFTRLNPGSDALKLSAVLLALGFMPYVLIASAALLAASLPSRDSHGRTLAALTVLAAASAAGLIGGLETLAAPVIISPRPTGGWIIPGTRPTAASAMELLVVAPLGVAAAAGWTAGFYLLHRATRRYMVGLLGSLFSLVAAPFVALTISGAAHSPLLLLPGAWSALLAFLGAIMTGIGFFLLGSNTGSLPLQVGGILLAASITPILFTASQAVIAYGLRELRRMQPRGCAASS